MVKKETKEEKIRFNTNNIQKPEILKGFQINNLKDIKTYIDEMEIKILSINKNEMEINIKGIDAPMINALRRNMSSEVPTMAIDKVIIFQNTSIIPDEVLVKRLALLPINADPDLYNFRNNNSEIYDENNSIKFKLHVKCSIKEEYKNTKYEELCKLEPKQYLNNYEVLAKDMVLEGFSSKTTEKYKENPSILFDKILIAKLRENQEIEVEVVCKKGTGKYHTKWSPVSVAFYKLKPYVEIKEKIEAEDIEDAINLCPVKVFGKNKKKIEVKNPLNCTMCRNCINDKKLGSKFDIGKLNDDYIMTIESIGVLSPEKIFMKSLEVLREKCLLNLNLLNSQIN